MFTVLLVDSKEENKPLFEKNKGHKVVHATSLETVLHNAAVKSFDCIFLDTNISADAGLDVLAAIKNNQIQTPVVVILNPSQQPQPYYSLGALDCILKPNITTETIERLTRIANHIKKVEAEKINAYEGMHKHANQLEAVLESTNSVVYALDTKYNLTAFNSAYRNTIAELYQIEVEIGKSIFNHPNLGLDHEAQLRNIAKALKGNQFIAELELGMAEGKRRFFEIAYNPVYNQNNEVVGVALYAQDITDKKKAQQALVDAKNEALKAARAKSDFLSNMSHEIRTPMNAIIGITDLLLDKINDEENREYLNSIRYSADNLLVIINDILDFSKMEAGKIKLEHISFDLYHKLTEIIKSFKHQADHKKLYLNLSIHPSVPNFVKGDPFRLNQVLFNLMGNAIKFTSKGGVTLMVKVLHTVKNKNIIHFAITDTGIGIPKGKVETIFESFTQAYTDTSRKFGGTGLGLAISKNLVELQNGYLGLKSQVGVGSTFYFEIPYEVADSSEEKITIVEKPTNPSLLGKTILLVEDNAMNQLVAKQILSKWQANVVIANNGSQALELMQEILFDMVLMDLQMPEMNGYDAAAHIREHKLGPNTQQIPIIALTADAFDETRDRVMATGMNDFITKPFKQDMLYAKITKHLSQTSKTA